MDIQRGKEVRRNRILKRIAISVVVLAALGGGGYAVMRLQPAVPTVEAGSVYPDTVKRGPMLREVHGLGTLVAEDVLWVPAIADGRVVKINVYPGTMVHPDTILMELDNPELQQQTVDAEFSVKVAEAGYTDLAVQLKTQLFDKKSAAALVTSDYKEAALHADRDLKLEKEGLIPKLDAEISTNKADQLKIRNDLEDERLKIIDESAQAQLAAQKVKIEQARALYALKKGQLDQLKVRAGATGVMAQLGPGAPAGSTTAATALEVGQKVVAGTILAKIAQPQKLKAELKINETEAKDIRLGQPAGIDTRNGIIQGKVSRIDPTAVNGNVTVDVKLIGALPDGARPDLSVDGTVELERLNDVVYMGRPTNGQPNGAISIFKYTPDKQYATRVQVKLGRASVNTIEILSGLKPGDQVILSDMTAQDGHDRIRLN
jgi:HlyD family secretion protein